mgnify:CR=1 FL=1
MKPYKVTIYVYAEDEQQIKELEKAAYEFVNSKYENGILVTASKLSQALSSFKNNSL